MLDQMLNVFEQHPSAHGVWLRLLELFHAPANTLCQVIGFKLQSFKVWGRAPKRPWRASRIADRTVRCKRARASARRPTPVAAPRSRPPACTRSLHTCWRTASSSSPTCTRTYVRARGFPPTLPSSRFIALTTCFRLAVFCRCCPRTAP